MLNSDDGRDVRPRTLATRIALRKVGTAGGGARSATHRTGLPPKIDVPSAEQSAALIHS
jgi:hypothetical protein